MWTCCLLEDIARRTGCQATGERFHLVDGDRRSRSEAVRPNGHSIGTLTEERDEGTGVAEDPHVEELALVVREGLMERAYLTFQT